MSRSVLQSSEMDEFLLLLSPQVDDMVELRRLKPESQDDMDRVEARLLLELWLPKDEFEGEWESCSGAPRPLWWESKKFGSISESTRGGYK